MQNKWYNQYWYKSWAMWMALAALVAYVAKTIFGQDIAPWLNGLMDILLPLAVGFGIVNNPNTTNGWVVPNSEIPAEQEADDADE